MQDHEPGGNEGSAAAQPASAPAPLSADELEALGRYDTPTVANAIETFDVRPRSAGFMRPEIRCIFPDMGVMVGYAVTARIRAAGPPVHGERIVSNFDWWDFILRQPAPRVIVLQDMDEPAAVGSFWGEVQSNIHKALGCAGTVTNGGVRDLNEVGPLGFHFFAPHVIVSHAYVRMLEFGEPVEIGGLAVRTGDLVHADVHGVQLVPLSIAPRIPEAAGQIFKREHTIIDYCQSPGFSAEGLKQVMRDLQKQTL